MVDQEIERLRSLLQHAYDEPKQSPMKEMLDRLKNRFVRPKPKQTPKSTTTPKKDKAA